MDRDAGMTCDPRAEAVELEIDEAGVVLIGPGLPAEEMASRLGTINYEVTCGIAARVPRSYHRDGAPA